MSIQSFCGAAAAALSLVSAAVFSAPPTTSISVLHPLTGADGAYARAGLALAGDGRFYGAAEDGGSNGVGTLFRITRDGAFDLLHSFSVPNGRYPQTTPMLARDGWLYGTTLSGGSYQLGSIYRISTAGQFEHLWSIGGQPGDPVYPDIDLTAHPDGSLWGIADDGGLNGTGGVFRFRPGGPALELIYSFSPEINYRNADGADPQAPLLLASDGNFYGTTSSGGDGARGTIFRLTPAGTLTVLHHFAESGLEGIDPYARLVEYGDGYLYGTNSTGGANTNGGVLFRIRPDGSNFAVVHPFAYEVDGSANRGLLKASDGFLYGINVGGAPIVTQVDVWASAFRYAPATGVEELREFEYAEGCNAPAWIAEGDPGSFMVLMGGCGENDIGVIEKLTVAPSPTLQFAASADVVSPRGDLGLSWSGQQVDGCEASGDWSGSQPVEGSLVLTAPRRGPAEYILECSGPLGLVRESVTVAVERGRAR